jgi:hypothetical protein
MQIIFLGKVRVFLLKQKTFRTMELKDLITDSVIYDKESQKIFSKDKTKHLLDIRGWSSILHKFKTFEEASIFQDNFGQFVADAINEKIKASDKKQA